MVSRTNFIELIMEELKIDFSFLSMFYFSNYEYVDRCGCKIKSYKKWQHEKIEVGRDYVS